MLVVIGAFAILMIIGLPLAFAFGLAGILGIQTGGLNPVVIPTRLITSIDSMALLAAPFYIFAGEIMGSAGITDRLITLSQRIMGKIRGATAYANVLASVFFSGISGSSVADTAALGQVFIRGMPKEGYTKEFAAAVTVASAVIGPIIPPSVTAVIYSAVTGVSVVSLFVAGIIPGLLLGLACFVVIYLKGVAGQLPDSRQTLLHADEPTWRLALDGIAVVSLPVLIVWGTVGGVFTPTEAGGVACIYAIFLGSVVFRSLSRRAFWEALKNSARASATVFFLVAMVSLASYVLIINGFGTLSDFLRTSFVDQPVPFLFATIAILLLLGMFLEPTVIIIVFVPLLTPVSRSLGIDDIHFAMTVILSLTMGMITPPVGINLFIAMRIGDIRMGALMKALYPFLIAHLFVIALIALVPPLSTYLPTVLR
ncbi:TRAP transporter large permease [Arsenicitalea aurantiaca]|uniref:TRAP transporter large permease protein n=1 Tax=Arsenicitalea aurantiaca TaxID=1783274 RepID=A0A433X471_9HYPH|nr:TRAP transporter large permease [Arsenicitalea aurantiaca]RUT28866.1 TRAP transporter large permease [Arsenicitalea aurantiaca]